MSSNLIYLLPVLCFTSTTSPFFSIFMLLRPFPSLFSPSRTSSLFLPRSIHSQLLRSAPAMLVSSQTIHLTPEEDRLCSLLQQFKQHVAKTEPDSHQVECRIAGGWVRDKVSLGVLCEERKGRWREKIELNFFFPSFLHLPLLSSPSTPSFASIFSSSPSLATTLTSLSQTTTDFPSPPPSQPSSKITTPRFLKRESQRSRATQNRANISRRPSRMSWGWSSTT